ncbi:uncharacterized protein LOC135817477 [Sycon ciliatum]|uniref:uncharacterized protein LOC135817477 n=1 Tax=Sycon ciliatum TaxID=27933 RepID=UPI0020AAFA43|eukprot:scpid56135/ scgid22809/ Lysine-specific demethylase 8; JmjC domain-containing protein 5; Jumonji domain-containing protein 5
MVAGWLLRYSSLAALAMSLALASNDQCIAGEDCLGSRQDSGLAHVETFEDIPEDMVQRGHLKELGSHRAPDSEVEVLPYMISPEDFYESYVVRHKPVVIKNAAKHWRATKLWTDEYLKKTFGDLKVHMETRDDDKWHIPESRKLGKFLDVYKEANLYLVDELPPAMRKDVTMPLCLRCDEIAKRFFVSYFWMSSGGTASKLHIDTDENLLSVIHGSKDVVLISPKYSRDVYADEARMLGVSEVNVSAVDFKKYPRIANVRYITAHLKAGDALYLPQMWWHYVYSGVGRQQAIAMWWKSIPYQKGFAVKSASTSRERTEAERQADPRITSLARWLEEYIAWIDDMRPDADTRPVCENQVKLMSEFPFETDRVQWREELTGKGRLKTENPDVDMEHRPLCYFDMKNPNNPCRTAACHGGQISDELVDFLNMTKPDVEEEGDGEEEEDDEAAEEANERECIRHILDYCERYEDRGCVIELPQYLNKKSDSELELINQLRSPLTPKN